MSTEIIFLNTTELSVDVYWLKSDEEEVRYASLGPQEFYTQSTYKGHRWVVRDARSGIVLGQTVGKAKAATYPIQCTARTTTTGEAVKVAFRNDSPVAVGVYWVDGQGTEHLYANLRPGHDYTQSTGGKHVWKVRSLHCGTEISQYIPNDDAEQTCIIDLKSRTGRRPVTAQFDNTSALYQEIVWLDDAGEAVIYHRLAPGERVSQPTFMGHPWLVRDAVSGTPVQVVPTMWQDVEIANDGSGLKSLPGTKPGPSDFRNLCARTGKLMWVGFDGSEQEFALLPPGAQVRIDTFAGHVWRLRDAEDGAELSLLIAAPERAQRSFEPQPTNGRVVRTVTIANRALLTVDIGVEGEGRVFYPMHRLGHGASISMRLTEGREIVIRDVASQLVLRRVRGLDSDLAVDLGPLDAKSQPGTESVSVVMRNDTPFDIDIAWMNFEGKEAHYARLSPGQSYTQLTGRQHVWHARERFSRHLMGVYVATDQAEQTMAFTMRSLESRTPTGIRFVNTTLMTVEVIWMDFDGKEKNYTTLRPGGSAGFRTYATHPWIVRDRASGRVLDWSWGDKPDAVITLDDDDIKPREGEVEVSATFTNRMSWAVDLFWLDYKGKEKHYGTLEPGQSLGLTTYETHPWRVRQAHSGEKIATYIATAEPKQQVDITLKSVSSDVATNVTFANHSPLTLEVYWLDYQGNEKLYATLEPRSRFLQKTYMTHPWIVRDKVSGEPVGFTVGLRDPQTLVLSGAPTRSRDGGSKVSLSMKNDSGLRADICWIDHGGKEVVYKTVDPGESFGVETSPAHAWRIREAEGGAEIDMYIASTAARQSHRIENKLVRTKERPNAELWPGEVAFYEHDDFRGKVWILHADTPDCRRIAGMNDKVSSIRVGPETAVTVFRHVRYKGTNDVIYMDTPSLVESDVGNDEISSLSIISTPPLTASRFSSTSRLTEDMQAVGGKITKEPVLRSMITLPPLTGMVDVWATEELTIRANGKRHVIDAVRPARLRAGDLGKLEILLDPDAIGKGALMLRTPAMHERERVFIFPDVDIHSKILGMSDDRLWQDRRKLGLKSGMSKDDAVHAARAIKSLSATVPAAHRSLSHGTSRDRIVIADRMSYDRWTLEFGGTGQTLFRPASRAELAAAGAHAIRLDDRAEQGFLDFLSDAAGAVETFFVETVPEAAETVAHETKDFFVEDVGGALEDAGEAFVDTVTPIARDIAGATVWVWDETVGWVERAAEGLEQAVVDGYTVIKDGVVQLASDAKDAFDELSADIRQGLTKAVEAVVRITMKVGGKVYQFVADTIEVVGKVLLKVLDGIGIVLGKLVRAFMDLFDLDGVLDVHDALVEKINSGIDMAEASISKLKSQTAVWLGQLQDEMVAGLDHAIDQAGGGQIARVDRDRPEDRSEAADKLDWLMSKLTDDTSEKGGGSKANTDLMNRIAGAMPGNTLSQLGGLIEPLVERLEEFINGDFGIVVDALGDSIALFRAALEQPSRAPGLVLSGALSLVKAFVVTGISLIELIADLVFDFFLKMLELIQTALNAKLDLPFLSAFYEGMTGRELSAISLVAFVVAIPASIMGQITLGRPILSKSRAAQTALSPGERATREEKQEWAVIYGVCHLCLNMFDLIYDISGAKVTKSKGDPNNTEMVEMHELRSRVTRPGGPREITGHTVSRVPVASPIPPTHYLNPAATSGPGAAMSIAKLGIIASVALAQIAGNPTGSVNGMHPDEMGKALAGQDLEGNPLSPQEAERARYGVIVWSWQWVYLALSAIDFGVGYAESLGAKGGGKVMEYGMPIATTVVGAVHMGIMSKYVNTDFWAEEWNTGGTDYRQEVLNRRRFCWLMDTFPAVTKVLAIHDVNKGTYYIPLGIHCVLFVTLGHLGEAITYFVRGTVDVEHEDFDL